ncbi:hypothetical protein ES703_05321 [subsurface metagenome]
MIKWSLHIIDLVTEWVGRVTLPFVLLIVVMLALEVVLRYGFNRATTWAWPISIQLAAAFGLVGGAYTLLHRGHVRVDVVYNRFPPKVRAVVDLVLSIPFFLFFGVLIWLGGEMAWESLIAREVAVEGITYPVYPLKMLLVAVCFLLFLQGVTQFIHNLGILITRKEAA